MARSSRRRGARSSPSTIVFVSSIGSRSTVSKRGRHGRAQHLFELLLALRVTDVHDHRAAGAQAVARQLEELPRREIERDVRLAVDVDHDHVVARALCGAGRAARPRGARACAGCAGRTSGGRASSAPDRSRRRPRACAGSSGRARAPSCRRRCPGSPPRAAAAAARRTAARGTRPSSRRSGRSPAGRASGPPGPRSAPACARRQAPRPRARTGSAFRPRRARRRRRLP